MRVIKCLLLISMFVGAIILSGCGEDKTPELLNNFAICLTENGAEMYGLYNCGHCNNQKEMFGNSFDKINYIECSVDQKRCSEKNIMGVPIWFFADGSSLSGVQSFVSLAQKTGCSLP